MDTIILGPLQLDDVDATVELARVVWQGHYPGIISQAQIDYMLAQRYKPGLIRQLMARGDLWLAARAGIEMVGFAHGHALQDGDYKLDKLYIHSGWQRHGIGGLLVREVASRAQRHGCVRLLVRVNRQNQQAINAYLKYGFQVATLIVEDIGGGFFMDDYVMIRELD